MIPHIPLVINGSFIYVRFCRFGTKIYICRMKRDLYWDSLKFVLIFLVVYGHTIETYSPDGSINRAIYNLIYVFHMPLFIFISGYFSKKYD